MANELSPGAELDKALREVARCILDGSEIDVSLFAFKEQLLTQPLEVVNALHRHVNDLSSGWYRVVPICTTQSVDTLSDPRVPFAVVENRNSAERRMELTAIGPFPRMFEAALRLIAEDLCTGRECNIDLYEHRGRISGRGQEVVARLGQLVRGVNRLCRVEPLERTACTGLSNRGVPFAFVDAAGREQVLQFTGGSSGIQTCQRASEAERLAAEAHSRRYCRYSKQTEQSKAELVSFGKTLVARLTTRVGRMQLTAEQREDYEYQMRNLRGDCTSSETLLHVGEAAAAIGLTLSYLIAQTAG